MNGRVRSAFDLFSDTADTGPGSPAVEAGDGTASYAELRAMAERLAARLDGAGAVGVAAGGGLALSVCLLAVVRAGTTAVVLAPDGPRGRESTAGVRLDVVLTDAGDRGEWPGVPHWDALVAASEDAPERYALPAAPSGTGADPVLVVPDGGGALTLRADGLAEAVAEQAGRLAVPAGAAVDPWREHSVPGALTAMLAAWSLGAVVRTGLPPAAAVAVDRDVLEERLTVFFRETLGDPGVGLDDDFFERGGHSLLALDLVFRIYDEFGLELSAQDVFEATTARRLAALADSRAHGDDGDYDSLVDEIASLSDDEVERMLREL
ncbi:phosphopantetheine-binding protein [Streptomyces sp. NPDC057682]|uniref:phosphopantetheine-binding protein n=1 Tax=Streptomyces sp. NPDC057682 TaxID=3346210 RepID=UPI0036AF4F04